MYANCSVSGFFSKILCSISLNQGLTVEGRTFHGRLLFFVLSSICMSALGDKQFKFFDLDANAES